MAASKDAEVSQARLAECEQRIETALRSFADIGAALKEIRDGKLYLLTHKTFADYVSGRWDIDRTYAHRVIEAAEVVRLMLPNGNKKCPPPAIESHARALVPVPEHLRSQVWESVWQATGGRPTAKAVEAAVSALARGATVPSAAGPAAPPRPAPVTAASLPAPDGVTPPPVSPPVPVMTETTAPDPVQLSPDAGRLLAQTRCDQLQAQVDQLEQLTASYEKTILSHERENGQLAAKLAEVQGWHTQASERVDQLEAENVRLRSRVSELEAAKTAPAPQPESEDDWQRRKPSAWAPANFRDPHPLGTRYPPGESGSADFHDQVVVRAWEGTPIGVDAGIAPLLTALWRLGYRTYVSCQGDPEGNWEEGWGAFIDFETPEMAQRFVTDSGVSECRVERSTLVRFPAGTVQALAARLRQPAEPAPDPVPAPQRFASFDDAMAAFDGRCRYPSCASGQAGRPTVAVKDEDGETWTGDVCDPCFKSLAGQATGWAWSRPDPDRAA